MRPHSQNTPTSSRPTLLIIGLSFLMCISAIAMMVTLSARTSTIVFSCIIVLLFFSSLIAIMLLVLLSRSKTINKVAALAEKRASLLKLVATLSLGILFTGTVNIAAASIAQAQFDLANHSTFPSLTLSADRIDGTPEYDLSSSVESAAYISLRIADRIFFRHEDTPCELTVDQPTALSGGTGSIDASTRNASFKPINHFTETENARETATKFIRSRLPDAEYISLDRCYEVTYFDYQNRAVTCHFSSSADGQLRPTETESHLHPANNIRSATYAEVPYEQALTSGLNQLLEHFSPDPKQLRYVL